MNNDIIPKVGYINIKKFESVQLKVVDNGYILTFSQPNKQTETHVAQSLDDVKDILINNLEKPNEQ